MSLFLNIMKRPISPIETPTCIVISALAIVAALFLLPSGASASMILWDTPVLVNTNDPTQISTEGTLLTAKSLTGNYTINGVSFTTGIEAIVTNESGGVATQQYGPRDTDYADLLAGGLYRSNAGTATINITGLTLGTEYQIQLITPYWNANLETQFDTVEMSNTQSAPTYVIGTFTADATTQNISFGAAPGSSFGILGALQVRAVPEPSTALLMGLGMGVLLYSRRHKRHGVS